MSDIRTVNFVGTIVYCEGTTFSTSYCHISTHAMSKRHAMGLLDGYLGFTSSTYHESSV